MEEQSSKSCKRCKANVCEPFISCTDCKAIPCLLCLGCFAKGYEDKVHENCHSYEVIRNDFPILDEKWTASEELKLLDAVLESGLGNWVEVAHHVATKTSQECEAHYNEKYIENPKSPLPELPDQLPNDAYKVVPLLYKACDDPPRPAINSQLYSEMAGYMAARGDFSVENDNYAENDICTMEFPKEVSQIETDVDESDEEEQNENDSLTDLKLSVLEIYNQRLRERARKNKIIARYGLIHVRKAALTLRRYVNSLGRRTTEALLPFLHLVDPIEFDLLMESFHYEQELKSRIQTLKEFRRMGLTRFRNAKLYVQLKQNRDENRQSSRFLDLVIDQFENKMACQQWVHRQVVQGVPAHMHRRPAPPLDISGLPGQEKLNENEKELCSYVRLVPEAYLEFKSIFIAEYQKQGFLRLAQARGLLKIDVNKTRKLFDFLVAENYINKGEN